MAKPILSSCPDSGESSFPDAITPLADRAITLFALKLTPAERAAISRLSTTYSISPDDTTTFCFLVGLEAVNNGEVDLAEYLIPAQISASIDLDLSPEMQARIDRLAARAGLAPDELVAQVIQHSYDAFTSGQLTLADLLTRLEEVG